MTQVSMSALVAGANAGQIVSFPTDTIPALAVRPDRSELVFAAKQRRPEKSLILMGAFSASLWSFVEGTDAELEIWQHVAQKYWPGALTLVLPASGKVPRAMNPTDPTTIGVRVPNSEVAIAILSQTGPLATTSANRSGKPPLHTMEVIEAEFPDVLTLHPTELEALEPIPTGVPSTVAKWMGNGWEILRQGSVRLDG
ncbi:MULTISPECIES: L-threonylcarbamoyladenylate synthase [unclassified Coleofasciculus]|uniref:L-threonylcarbamoyladenylate synthase n=1 Tax=unclassified Coleofasciculus TaxID=2692782 RepID=UPI00187FEF4F|nr:MULTISPECIES: L-threonylcarbamoyladenylate synthase [unclassified Coleofasciculus]MBE9128575.1 L-threonylcarbamoyladenylate synthase [Coleofasciculus sp. LEGE 07081]MBE9147930.1 L-threonylcarbamoyladenylate synthase [Coleofasciculus sp. LEGE 07092]